MSLEVIGAGLGRTGTLSLKLALERLGYSPCHHMVEVMTHPETTALWRRAAEGEPIDWEEIYGAYRATVDWPGCHFYKQLAQAYPKAKLVLTTRDPKRWLESMKETILKFMTTMRENAPPEALEGMRFIDIIVDEQTFHGDYSDDNVIAAYERHVANVKRDIPPESILVYAVSEGWEPLCRFLGAKVPAQPFPKVNSREEFWSHTVAPVDRQPS